MIKSLIVATLLATGAQAGAALLTFEQFQNPDELRGVGSEIQEAGFLLRYEPAPGEPHPTSFYAVTPVWRYHYGTSTAILANSCSASVILSSIDGIRFNLVSIALQELNGTQPSSVTFQGFRGEGQGAAVAHTHHLNGTTDWEVLSLPDTFRNLKYVVWHQGDCYANQPHMFDDIVVEPTRVR